MGFGGIFPGQSVPSGGGTPVFQPGTDGGFGLSPEAQFLLDAAQSLVDSGQATDLTEAIRVLGTVSPELFPEEPEAVRAGSAAAMLSAQASMLTAQENQRQGAYDRVVDRLRLLQATDELQDARRENAMSALIQAAPLLVAPGTQFSPGFEPGGPAMQLSALVGGNVQPQPLVTAPLPLGEFVNEPRSVTPETVNRDLGALLGG